MIQDAIARPQGGVCVFMRVHGVADIEDFCRQLADESGVLLVPGTSFGQPNHVRLGFGCSTGELTEGLSRLSEHFHKYHQLQPQVAPVQQTASSA